jgi:hypothetical protein
MSRMLRCPPSCGHSVVGVGVLALPNLRGVPVDADAGALEHVDQAHAAVHLLVEPDDRAVVVADVPGRPDRLARHPREVADAALVLGARHVRAVVGAGDRGVEVAAVLLRDDRLGLLLPALGDELALLARDDVGRDGAGVLDRQHLAEPLFRVRLRVAHQLREVVVPPRRADEQRPAAVLRQDRADERPAARVAQRVLGEDDADRRRADERVVVVRADDLPRRAVLEPDEHVLLARRVAERQRERVVNPAPAGAGVDRVPDRLSGLVVLRQHVPVAADARHRAGRGPVQAHVVLAGAAVPRERQALFAGDSSCSQAGIWYGRGRQPL